MKNSILHNLNLNLVDHSALKQLEIGTEIDISINFEEIVSITHSDNSVLVIKFKNGEFRLDLSIEDLLRKKLPDSLCLKKSYVKERERFV